MSLKNACPKGQRCGYIHVFDNPSEHYSIRKLLSIQREKKFAPQMNKYVGKSQQEHILLVGLSLCSTWNEVQENERNWRWSESPERNQEKLSKTSVERTKSSRSKIVSSEENNCIDSRRQSRSHKQSHSRENFQARNRSKSHKARKRKRSRSGRSK